MQICNIALQKSSFLTVKKMYIYREIEAFNSQTSNFTYVISFRHIESVGVARRCPWGLDSRAKSEQMDVLTYMEFCSNLLVI